jgi:hypothetical protein
MVGHGRDLPRGPAGGDDHEIGQRAFSLQRDDDDFLALIVLDRGDDAVLEVFRRQRFGSRNRFSPGAGGGFKLDDGRYGFNLQFSVLP